MIFSYKKKKKEGFSDAYFYVKFLCRPVEFMHVLWQLSQLLDLSFAFGAKKTGWSGPPTPRYPHYYFFFAVSQVFTIFYEFFVRQNIFGPNISVILSRLTHADHYFWAIWFSLFGMNFNGGNIKTR